jgi:hypothetical protein
MDSWRREALRAHRRRQLGLDNNYQYAVYPDGRIEQAYQGFDPTYDPNMSATPDPGMRYRTLSELLAQGGQKAASTLTACRLFRAMLAAIAMRRSPT